MKNRTEPISESMTADMTDEERKERRKKWMSEIERKRKEKGIEGNISSNFMLFQDLSEISDKWVRHNPDGPHDCLMMISATSLGKLNDKEHHQVIGVHMVGQGSDMTRMFAAFFESHPEHIPTILHAIAETPIGQLTLANMAVIKIGRDEIDERYAQEETKKREPVDEQEKEPSRPIRVRPEYHDLPEKHIPPTWDQAWVINSKVMESTLKEREAEGEVPMLSKNFEIISHAQYILRHFDSKEGTNEEHDAVLFLGEFGMTKEEYRSTAMMQGDTKAILRMLIGFIEDNPEYLPVFEYATQKAKEGIGPIGALVGAMKMHDFLTKG